MLRTLFAATILAGALAGSAMAQAPDAGCALPSEPEGIPAAIDAVIAVREASLRAKCASGDFKTFLVRSIVIANSDNVIDSTCHNR
jgi:hypothetical protein